MQQEAISIYSPGPERFRKNASPGATLDCWRARAAVKPQNAPVSVPAATHPYLEGEKKAELNSEDQSHNCGRKTKKMQAEQGYTIS